MKLKNPLETAAGLSMDVGTSVSSVTIFAPAKLNLFLAITGRRADGFHDLVSVVVPLEFGDTLTAESSAGEGVGLSLSCTDPDVPCDDTNLVLRAAKAYAEAAGGAGRVSFRLEKRVPMGAGLGGGSSDGAAALRALNQLNGGRLSPTELARLAATLGSDCPLFLHAVPVVMRGRGERVETLPAEPAARLRGRHVIVFKPPFAIPTAWAYKKMAVDASDAGKVGGADGVYLPEPVAEQRLAAWVADRTAPAESLLFNNMERAAFAKYVAIPTLLDQLRREFSLQPRMTGSGSACFAFVGEDAPVEAITALIRRGWGDAAFVVVTRIA